MRAQQTGFDFNLFDMAGFTAPTIDDWGAAERRKAEQERKEYERRKRERHDREQREREEHARRARSRSSAYESPWDVLGVRAGASKSEVRAAWIALCKRFHPDAGGSLADMQRVNAAYQGMKGMAK